MLHAQELRCPDKPQYLRDQLLPSLGCSAELAQQWHPYVLLGDNYTRVDVHAGQAQPFLVTIHADADVAGGTYVGKITIRDGSGTERSVAVSVEVWDFALPAAHSLPTIWGWDDHRYAELYCVHKEPKYCTVNETQPMLDFFIEHRMPINSMCTDPT